MARLFIWLSDALGIARLENLIERLFYQTTAQHKEIMAQIEELQAIIGRLAQAVEELSTSTTQGLDSLSSVVVTEIAQITDKLSQIGSPNLTEPIAQLSNLAGQVSNTAAEITGRIEQLSDQVAGIIPDEAKPEPEPEPEPETEPEI